MGRWIISLILAVMGMGWSVGSSAQELGTQTIEQRAQEAPTLGVSLDALILTGEDDLVLLRRPKLFTIESNSSYQLTDNAFLSDKQKTHDYVVSQSLLVRAETRIAQRVGVFVSGSGFLSRYHRNQGLDFNGVAGSVGANVPVDQWVVSLRYDGSAIFDRNFDAHFVTLHNLGLDLSTTIGLGETTALYPFASVVRVWATPDDFSSTAFAGGGTLVYVFTQTVVVFL